LASSLLDAALRRACVRGAASLRARSGRLVGVDLVEVLGERGQRLRLSRLIMPSPLVSAARRPLAMTAPLGCGDRERRASEAQGE
jgi:hypothetical protein